MWKSMLMTVAVMVMTSQAIAANTAPDSGGLQATDPEASVQALYSKCTSTDVHQLMFCAGYFNATIDNMMVTGSDSSTQAFGICTNGTISDGAAMQAFKNWAQKHPEMWGMVRIMGVVLAMQEVWPCKKPS
jgi:hypothetical protein